MTTDNAPKEQPEKPDAKELKMNFIAGDTEIVDPKEIWINGNRWVKAETKAEPASPTEQGGEYRVLGGKLCIHEPQEYDHNLYRDLMPEELRAIASRLNAAPKEESQSEMDIFRAGYMVAKFGYNPNAIHDGMSEFAIKNFFEEYKATRTLPSPPDSNT